MRSEEFYRRLLANEIQDLATKRRYFRSKFIDGKDATKYQEQIAPLIHSIACTIETFGDDELEAYAEEQKTIAVG
jgi:hypothetical protein